MFVGTGEARSDGWVLATPLGHGAQHEDGDDADAGGAAAAIGVGVVAVLVLRAMAEWRRPPSNR